MTYERQGSFNYETQLISLLAVNRQRKMAVSIIDKYLLVLSYPDLIPQKQLKLPFDVSNSGELRGVLSEDGKYLAFSYFLDGISKMLLIDTRNTRVQSSFPIDFSIARAGVRFNRDSTLLLTVVAGYDVQNGKEVKVWDRPSVPAYPNNISNLNFLSGRLSNGNLLLSSSVNDKIYELDSKKGVVRIYKDFDDPGVTVKAGRISPDGSFLVSLISTRIKELSESVETRMAVWRIETGLLTPYYEEKITENNYLTDFVWNSKNGIIKITANKKNGLSIANCELLSQARFTCTSFPVTGHTELNGFNDWWITPDHFHTYGRYWDIDTGKKIWPIYEALDPFDDSNTLPLYNKKSEPFTIRNYWND